MRRLVTGAAVAVLVGLVALLGWQLVRGDSGRAFAQAVDAGHRPAAPGFDLPRLDGRGSVGLAALRGRPVVLNFWASWCLDCKVEAPDLAAIAARWRPHGVAFVGIDSQDFTQDARRFAARYGDPYPLVSDTQHVNQSYGVTGFPETFVIDRRGRAIAHFVGPVDAARVDAALRSAGAT